MQTFYMLSNIAKFGQKPGSCSTLVQPQDHDAIIRTHKPGGGLQTTPLRAPHLIKETAGIDPLGFRLV